jgi:hypothetical protein
MWNCNHKFCLSNAWKILHGIGCFYDWRRWKRISEDERRAVGFRCQAEEYDCDFHEEGSFQDPLLYLQVHHVLTLDEIAEGEDGDEQLAIDHSNLRALCLPHHNLIHRRPEFWHQTIKPRQVEMAFSAHAVRHGRVIHKQIPLVLPGDELLQIPHR